MTAIARSVMCPCLGVFGSDAINRRQRKSREHEHHREVIRMRLLIVVAAAFLSFAVACQLADQHGTASRKPTVDARMEELKYSQFCTEAADKFWKRHDWAGQQDAHMINSYTSHYNKRLNKCFVDVHGLALLSAEHKVMEADHVYDALEDTVVGGRVILRKGGQDGEIQSVVLIRDGHPIRDEQERAAFLPWFQSLMAE